MINLRKLPKQLIQFGKREYREKKPLKVTISRVRDKTIFKRGFIPSLIIKQHELIQYVIIAEYDVILRLYLFTPNGILLGAENIEKNSIFLKRLMKCSNVIYSLP
ncbi:MAG: hypothetical protein ACFE8M_12775 [Candidatus Hermodarchaeota archaeon]